MADFRKSLLLAAAAIVVGVGTTGTAFAQAAPGTCSGTVGAPPELRSEGQTELTGSIVLSCNAVLAGSVNLDITLNNGTVPITSRTDEAIVTVNGGAPYYGTVVSLGGSVANNDVRFTGVTIPAGNPVISISGIRADVNPAYVPLNSGGFGQVLAVISVSNGVLPISQLNGGFFVGIVLPGLGNVTVTGPILNACAGSINLGAGVNFTVSVPELFPTVFKIQGPNGNSDSETGPTPGALQANSATQLAVSMSSLPSGVTFYLPETITSNGPGTAVLVTGPASITPLTSGIALDDSGTLYVAVTAGTDYYYNVIATNPSVSEAFSIPIWNTGATFTSGFTPSITVNLAPIASISPTTVPRFLGAAPAVGLGFTTTGCQTSLLFPFLTNQAGFDTGFSIDASGTDPFGTSIAGGTCTMNLYGSNPPATAPVLTVPTSGEGHATISAVAPNFQGYGIAVCDFTYAHGYAFLSDGFMGGGRGLSEGYVALVIDDRGSASSDVGIDGPEALRQ
jgi:hypothetical protein